MTSFLSSPEGKRLLEGLDDPDSPTTSHGMKMAIIGLVTAGVICVSMGIGFYLVADIVNEDLLIPGAILGAIGVGCLIGASFTTPLARSAISACCGSPMSKASAIERLQRSST